MRQVVGLSGKIASGKSIVADYLIERGASYYRFSDVLRDILKRLHVEDTRGNLQGLGGSLRELFGDDILARVLKADILSDGGQLIVVDGVRYAGEARMLRDVGGIIVFVEAPAKIRYERAVGRGTRGEAKLSFEEFLNNEGMPTELGIEGVGEAADYRIINTGTIGELKAKVDEILDWPSMHAP
jgi:dephospho-CoA kinase